MTISRTARQAALLASLLLSAACAQPKAPPGPEAVPVRVATVAKKTILSQVRAIGAVEPVSTVAIKALVDGQVTAVAFQEGQEVRQGQLLFTIDRRPFEIAVQRAQATLAKDQAQRENAELQKRRYEDLTQQGIVSRDLYDQARANADALGAAMQADQAAVEQAKLELGYCSITAPFEGRTGSLIVHQGNLVKANEDPPLVIINQLSPIRVRFAVPQELLPEIQRRMGAGSLTVEARPEDTGDTEQGVLTFIDNTVNQKTGTIQLKATFPNQDRRLWPGLFVNTVLTVGEQRDSTVVPEQAVQSGQSGFYVFVIGPDLTAAVRRVEVGKTAAGETVIERGLQPGERVVTDGQIRLVSGSKVQIQSGPEGSAS